MSTDFDARLGQQAEDTSSIVDELKSKIVYDRQQVTEQINKLSEEINTVKNKFAKDEEVFQKRQGEHLEHLLQAVEKGKVTAVLDSGSQVCILSERVYESLISTGLQILTSPLENVALITAFGNRKRGIKFQAYLEFCIGEDRF
jgi:hypothetical protein